MEKQRLIIKKINLELAESIKEELDKLCLLTGLSFDAIIIGILWDYILKEEKKKKEKKHGRQKGALSNGNSKGVKRL